MNANELANYIEDEYLNGMECEHGFLVFENGGCPNEGCKRQDFYKAATMLRQLQTKVDGLQYNADLHTKKIHWLAINYPDVNNHLFETIKTGEIYNLEDK